MVRLCTSHPCHWPCSIAHCPCPCIELQLQLSWTRMRWAELNRDLPPPARALGCGPHPSALPCPQRTRGMAAHHIAIVQPVPQSAVFHPGFELSEALAISVPVADLHACRAVHGAHPQRHLGERQPADTTVRHFIVPATNCWRWLSMLSPIRWVVMVCWWWGRLEIGGAQGRASCWREEPRLGWDAARSRIRP